MDNEKAIEPVPNCTLPDVPIRQLPDDISPHREYLIRTLEKKWVNGTKLQYYYFRDGENSTDDVETQIEKVEAAFDAWKEEDIGIEFQETDSIDEAEVRIGFKRGDGSWSYLGRDVLQVPGQYERTMNFGWDLTQDPRGDGVDTPIHEIGHTLGFPHEHQNPLAGIDWNEQAVYDYFMGPPNSWTTAQVERNVLDKFPVESIEGSEWDANSIMHYAFHAALIDGPDPYDELGISPEDGLSVIDGDRARKFYPGEDDYEFPVLEPFESQIMSLGPGEQRNFTIEPDATRDYTIQTFGYSDTVMVLFEEYDDELKYVKGDDDSGTNRNARITRRLYAGRRYVLRVRLYYNWGSADTAVMLW
jgi:hypothetical protein